MCIYIYIYITFNVSEAYMADGAIKILKTIEVIQFILEYFTVESIQTKVQVISVIQFF